MLAVLTIEPRPAGFMTRAACLTPRKAERARTPNIASHSSTVTSSRRSQRPTRPALLNMQSSRPKRLDGQVDGGRDVGFAGDVGVPEHAGRSELRGQSLASLVVDVGDHHRRTEFDEAPRRRCADAAGAAGDDGGSAGKRTHVGPPFRLHPVLNPSYQVSLDYYPNPRLTRRLGRLVAGRSAVSVPRAAWSADTPSRNTRTVATKRGSGQGGGRDGPGEPRGPFTVDRREAGDVEAAVEAANREAARQPVGGGAIGRRNLRRRRSGTRVEGAQVMSQRHSGRDALPASMVAKRTRTQSSKPSLAAGSSGSTSDGRCVANASVGTPVDPTPTVDVVDVAIRSNSVLAPADRRNGRPGLGLPDPLRTSGGFGTPVHPPSISPAQSGCGVITRVPRGSPHLQNPW